MDEIHWESVRKVTATGMRAYGQNRLRTGRHKILTIIDIIVDYIHHSACHIIADKSGNWKHITAGNP
jgi:hypothetical protein